MHQIQFIKFLTDLNNWYMPIVGKVQSEIRNDSDN